MRLCPARACDLRCSYCDTAYAFAEGSKKSLAEVRAEVQRLAGPFGEVRSPKSEGRSDRLPLVELTGGEPLLQKNSLPLMQALCDDGFTVLLETSGAHDIAPVDPRVRRIMDLKCPGSGEAARNRWENLPHLKSTDEIKFVIATREDYEWAKERIAEHKLAAICPLLFSWAHPLAPGAAGQVAQAGAAGPDADFAPGTGGEDHRGCAARAVSGAVAQGDLGARAKRSLTTDEHRWTQMGEPPGRNCLVYLCPSVFICGSNMMTTRQTLDLLRAYESRNVTFIEPDGSWPIVWERARGVHVWDADGKKYLDLTAAFGVAATGHANPRVVRAGQRQMARLLHAMGDVHPHALKAQLARELSRITFERWLDEVQSPKSKVQSHRAARVGGRGQDDLLQLGL